MDNALSVYTSGKGSSAVGLTASVVRDPETRDLVLESGALVLSDLGTCCIDEFDKMSDSTRSVLHEAMEQQTVSIAKAGIIASLHARTSVLASANPIESRYNPNRSVVDNIQLPPTLLSRFDLIYLILDNPNVEQDRRLAQHLVGLYYETPNVVEPPLDHSLLRDYIQYAREFVHPSISDEASKQLVSSYLELRNPAGGSYGSNGTKTISATARQLESLIRISEALAKMRYSDCVTRADALEAVRLMKVATQTAATDPRTGRIDMDMIATGRSAVDRQQEEQVEANLKELFAERRGSRMAIRDVTKQLSEISNIAVTSDDIIEVLRQFDAEGIIQLNERAQTIFVRTGIIRS
jgi:DNA replication licensing factor MCM4